MRTPWRIVADLVSRKPRADDSDASPAAIPEIKALEHEPGSEEQRPAVETKPVERSSELAWDKDADATPSIPDVTPKRASVSQEASSKPADGVWSVSADEEAPALVPVRGKGEKLAKAETVTLPIDATAKPEPKRRPKADPAAKRMLAVRQTADEAPVVVAGPKSLIDEIAELEVEVDDLRRQLAKKLAEQNAQLRKMLARFETP